MSILEIDENIASHEITLDVPLNILEEENIAITVSANVKNYKDIDFENNEISFLVIVRCLLWKNFLQQWKRRKCSMIAKFLSPSVCILVLGVLRFLFQATSYDVNYGRTNLDFINSTSIQSRNWISNVLCSSIDIPAFKETGYLAISPQPSSNIHLQHLIDIINDSWTTNSWNDNYSSLNEAYEASTSCETYASWLPFDTEWLLRFFDSDEDINNYIASNVYGTQSWKLPSNDDKRPISIAISFTDISDDGFVWKYNIRQNVSLAVRTSDDNVDRFERNAATLDTKPSHYRNGFINIETFVDNAIMQYISELQFGFDRNESKEFVQRENEAITKGFFQFPVAEYERDQYWQKLSAIFWVFILVQYLYPFSQIASELVHEKACRIKEGMKIMGATVGAFWFSWYLWFIIEFTIIALLVTGIEFVCNVFIYSDFWIIFLWTWLFLMMLMSYGALISCFCDDPYFSMLVAFLTYTASIICGLFCSTMTATEIQLLCLVGPACYVVSLNNVIKYEWSLIGIQWDNINDEYENFRFSSCLWFMIFDTIIYIVLTLYFDRVWPSRYGQKIHPLFFLSPSYWFPNRECSVNNYIISDLPSNYEPAEKFDANGKRKKISIVIRGLKKFFGNIFSSNLILAVNGIDLNIYEGEVFCLLGRNGAGKSTTIGMLTGLLTITEGIAFINGNNVKTNMSAIRKSLGICPQHNILWPRLTAYEHLLFFACVKGVPEQYVENEVQKVIHMCEIADNAALFPTQMCGGQKRKLCLAIALIGGSKILFLDEPTSGMDPESRRATWDLIQKEKKNRCIILTTHCMDEADILADRIAIMSNGLIRCCGTSLYLKRLYCVGYNFVISLKIGIDPYLVKKHMDDIILRSIEGSTVISVDGGEISYRLPFSESASFASVFNAIGEKKDNLCITSYGISVTTLEEVFLNVEQNRKHSIKSPQTDNETATLLPATNIDNMNVTYKHTNHYQFEHSAFLMEQNECYIILTHIKAILYRRLFMSIRDFRSICCQILLPAFFSFLGLSILASTIALKPNLPLMMTSDQWYPPSKYSIFINRANTTENSFLSSDFQTLFDDNFAGELEYLDMNYSSSISTNIKTFQDLLLNSSSPSNGILHYNAFYAPVAYSSNNMIIGYNMSAIHALPTAYAVLDNCILANMTGNGDAKIYVSSYPFPVTSTDKFHYKAVSNKETDILASIFLMIAFAFIPVGAMYNIVNDRASHTKHQQMVSGMSFISYWIGNFIADFVSCIPATCFVFIMINIYNCHNFSGEAEAPFIAVLYMFVLSILPFTYLLSYLFSSADKAQMWTAFLYLILGMVLLVLSFLVSDLPNVSEETKAFLDDIYRISPSFLMANSLHQLSVQQDEYPDLDVWDEEIVGKNLRYMGYEFFGYFALFFLIEYSYEFSEMLKKIGFVFNIPMENEMLDEDVEQEQIRIKAMVNDEGLIDKKRAPTLVLAGVRKIYGNVLKCISSVPVVAVRNIWLGIPQGEVFGYLGVNGAGKTTTLACLTGEKNLSSGKAYICGNSITNQTQCRKFLGYCPQFDALYDLLTGREHLMFYAMIKGLSGEELETQVNMLLKVFSLEKYQNFRADTYSGGNKRKLSVAIAMIGNPPVVFLDEPSAGMDPMARREMWEYIRSTMKGRCVVLTTHSMEECEALCHRLGIMVDGQLQCIGTPQHLKSRFGHGYQLDITMAEDTAQCRSAIVKQLKAVLGMDAVNMIEHSQTRLVFEIIDKISLATIFENMEKLKNGNFGIESYAVNQTSLEQIFIKMAKQHRFNSK